MRIQHNITALNAQRQLTANNLAVSKSVEKLSSGYAINRAGDDAAGLAISEKMRGQIRGLNQAQANANDGISLVQTAEGGLNETHSILQTMRELAVQSANGTYQNTTDRENLEAESKALMQEIDRIASSTAYNKINLLDGSLDVVNGGTVTVNSQDLTFTGLDVGKTLSFEIKAGADGDAKNGTAEATVDGNGNASVVLYTGFGTDVAVTVEDINKALADAGSQAVVSYTSDSINTGDAAAAAVSGTAAATDKVGLTFQIGANASAAERVTLKIGDMSCKGLNITGVSIATPEDAANAIETIDNAINRVSSTRSDLGAMQNRLEHTVANLGTTSENLTSAESQIRDVDMASEMMNMTKMNILSQAAQSMLAQANSMPQNVLQLLQ